MSSSSSSENIHSSVAERFGQLRSLMHRPPSPSLWQEVCAIYSKQGRAPAPLTEAEELYLGEHMRRWPVDVTRPAPTDWLAPLLAMDTTHPLLAMSTTLRCTKRVFDIEGHLDALMLAPDLFEQLNELELPYQRLHAGDLVAFLMLPYQSTLRDLDLTGNLLHLHGALELLTTLKLHLGDLEALTLADAQLFGGPQLTSFLQSPLVRGLERLDLSRNVFSHGGESLYAGLRGARELRSLALRRCGLTPSSLSSLAALMLDFEQFETLNLADGFLQDEELAEFFGELRGAPCTRLVLHGNDAQAGALNTLATSLHALTHLTLGAPEEAEELARDEELHDSFDELRWLELFGEECEGLLALLLADRDALPSLETIHLETIEPHADFEALVDYIDDSMARHLVCDHLNVNEAMLAALARLDRGGIESLCVHRLSGPPEHVATVRSFFIYEDPPPLRRSRDSPFALD